ncbi:MAG: DUF4007 family protein [Magnetococcales bacterium]|nr:DUF4007 family protein [Magnetococcales bacterium]
MNRSALLVSAFEPSRIAFGRHETFPLRYSWLTKGFQALLEDPGVFSSDEATVTLGVGKNMVNSIRYWLRAMRMMDAKDNAPTSLGRKLLAEDGYDPYLEDEATIWLLHWLHATNPEQATTAYWLFNRFHKPTFASEEAVSALVTFVKENVTGKYSINTVKQDIAVILRMYAPSRKATKVAMEDALDSPLAALRLITRQEIQRGFISYPEARSSLPVEIVGYAITELLRFHGERAIQFQELMYGRFGQLALGSIFRLSETALLTILEQLVVKYHKHYEIRETAGVHQLYQLDDVNPGMFLDRHFGQHAGKVAA